MHNTGIRRLMSRHNTKDDSPSFCLSLSFSSTISNSRSATATADCLCSLHTHQGGSSIPRIRRSHMPHRPPRKQAQLYAGFPDPRTWGSCNLEIFPEPATGKHRTIYKKTRPPPPIPHLLSFPSFPFNSLYEQSSSHLLLLPFFTPCLPLNPSPLCAPL